MERLIPRTGLCALCLSAVLSLPATANAVQLLDPEKIVIGGGVAGLGQPLLKSTRRALLRLVPFYPGRRLGLVFSKLGRDAGVVGASRLVECRFE